MRSLDEKLRLKIFLKSQTCTSGCRFFIGAPFQIPDSAVTSVDKRLDLPRGQSQRHREEWVSEFLSENKNQSLIKKLPSPPKQGHCTMPGHQDSIIAMGQGPLCTPHSFLLQMKVFAIVILALICHCILCMCQGGGTSGDR